MQLTYRGTQYNAASASPNTACTKLTATYRGVTYPVLKAKPTAAMPTQRLRYRGIAIGETEVSYQPVDRPAMA